MLSVVLAVSYQSLHIFLHHNHTEKEIVTIQKTNTTFSKTITEKQDCHTCDFKFASFLSPENFAYSFFFPFKESPYSFSVKEALSFFTGSLYSLRGPPFLI